MNEAETRAELIDPAVKDAGWGVVEGSRVLRERNCQITLGRLKGAGQRGKPEIADYILVYRNRKLVKTNKWKLEYRPVTEYVRTGANPDPNLPPPKNKLPHGPKPPSKDSYRMVQ